MSILAKCPACGEEFLRPDGLAGKKEKCPECRYVFRLPTSKSAHNAGAPRPRAETLLPPTQPVKRPAAPLVEPPRQRARTETERPLGQHIISPAAPVVEPPRPPVETMRPVEQHIIRPIAPVVEEEITLEEALQPRVEQVESPAPPIVDDEIIREEAAKSWQEQLESPAPPIFEEQPPLPEADLPPLETEMGQVFPEAKVLLPELEAHHSLEPNVDFVALAAQEVSSGRSLDDVVDILFEQGMDELEAQQLAESMIKIASRHKKSKGILLLRILMGIFLAVINFLGSWWVIINRSSPGMFLATLGLAVVGVYLFFSGLWRLIWRSRPMKAKKLIAAWQKQNP